MAERAGQFPWVGRPAPSRTQPLAGSPGRAGPRWARAGWERTG
jgi:hypothetical protein